MEKQVAGNISQQPATSYPQKKNKASAFPGRRQVGQVRQFEASGPVPVGVCPHADKVILPGISLRVIKKKSLLLM